MNRQIGGRLAGLNTKISTKRASRKANPASIFKRLTSNGNITFSVKTFATTEKKMHEMRLFIEIEKCQDLPFRVCHRSICPYVVIKFNGEQVGSTPVLKGTRNPIWYDECFEFAIVNENEKLLLEVWDVRKNNLTVCIGKSVLDLSLFGSDLKLFNSQLGLLQGDGSSREEHISIHKQSSFLSKIPTLRLSSRRIPFEKPQKADFKRNKVMNPEPLRRHYDFRLGMNGQHIENPLIDSTAAKAMGLILVYLLIGIIGFSFSFEAWSIRDSLYFSVVTFTTVGKRWI